MHARNISLIGIYIIPLDEHFLSREPMGKTNEIVAVIMLFQFFISCLGFNINQVGCQSPLQIDVYTQKSPHDGKGLNNSSDSFTLLENVSLYSFVEYNNAPLPHAFVTYIIEGPANPVYNFTLVGTRRTNEQGITIFSFTIPSNEETTFGEWNIIARVSFAEKTAEDTLIFKVGWIVDIVSIITVDETLKPKTIFSVKSPLGVNITLRNIALTSKPASIFIIAKDETNTIIDSAELDGLNIEAETEIKVHTQLYIPREAAVGNATIFVSAFTAPPKLGGIPYCPEKSATFFIIYRDVAVIDITPSSETIIIGETVNVVVQVRNEGTQLESFNVSIYVNLNLVEIFHVESLQPNAEKSLNFVWTTDEMSEGTHTLSAYATLIPEEILTNNNYVEAKVTIVTPSPTVHDIAIMNVVPSLSEANRGELINLTVTVKNEGTETENFNINIYLNDTPISTLSVTSLIPHDKTTLLFVLNTSDIADGSYTVKARADLVEGEVNLEDNTFTDGIIKINSPSSDPPSDSPPDPPRTSSTTFIPRWLITLLLVIAAILAIFLIIMLLYKRRKRKEFREPFERAWKAWYSTEKYPRE